MAAHATSAQTSVGAARPVNESGLQQRAQLAREDGDYLKQFGEKGLIINTTKPDSFRAALVEVGYYKDARSRFGEQPWALMEKYTGPLG